VNVSTPTISGAFANVLKLDSTFNFDVLVYGENQTSCTGPLNDYAPSIPSTRCYSMGGGPSLQLSKDLSSNEVLYGSRTHKIKKKKTCSTCTQLVFSLLSSVFCDSQCLSCAIFGVTELDTCVPIPLGPSNIEFIRALPPQSPRSFAVVQYNETAADCSAPLMAPQFATSNQCQLGSDGLYFRIDPLLSTTVRFFSPSDFHTTRRVGR
jgi:hypothetical protein